MVSPTAGWHPFSPPINIFYTTRPSRTCPTLRHLFATFRIHSNSSSSRSVFRNSWQSSAKLTFRTLPEPSKWLGNPPKHFLNPCEPFGSLQIQSFRNFPNLSSAWTIPPQPSTSPAFVNRSVITPAPSKVPPESFWTRLKPSKKTHLWNPSQRLKPSPYTPYRNWA